MIYFRLTSSLTGFVQLRECAATEVAGWIAFAAEFGYGIELWAAPE